jgi:hypothetical protein
MPKGTAPLDLPEDVVQAAAERANTENMSLTEVTAALLREYADGKSWANVPETEPDSAHSPDAQLVRRIRRVHGETWADEAARRGMLTGLLVARELLREQAGGRHRSLPEAMTDALGKET